MKNSIINLENNFLNENDFLNIKNVMLKTGSESAFSSFPWYYLDYKVTTEYNSFDNYQFVHMFYDNETAKITEYFYIIEPILQKLNAKTIVRIKANLTMSAKEHCIYGFHIDYPDCKTAIFYLNDNDGYTLFKDGTKIESVENRLVSFDSNLEHTGVSCVKSKIRCVINFNYI